ncbi:MAG: 50S ribosomal protein L29 [Anaerolineae bacterium]|nr:50S ribosomal protein L29 [Anaerolineae bacterium]
MKPAELRQLTVDELRHRLDETYQELLNLRFQLATKQLADTSRIRQVKREIARLQTVLGERTREERGQA